MVFLLLLTSFHPLRIQSETNFLDIWFSWFRSISISMSQYIQSEIKSLFQVFESLNIIGGNNATKLRDDKWKMRQSLQNLKCQRRRCEFIIMRSRSRRNKNRSREDGFSQHDIRKKERLQCCPDWLYEYGLKSFLKIIVESYGKRKKDIPISRSEKLAKGHAIQSRSTCFAITCRSFRLSETVNRLSSSTSNARVIAVSLEIEAMDTVSGEEAMDCKVWARGEEDFKRFSIHRIKQ